MAVLRQRASSATGEMSLGGSKAQQQQQQQQQGGTDNLGAASSDEKPLPGPSMLWAERLRKYVGTGPGLGSEALTEMETKRILHEAFRERQQKSAEAGAIPSFYKKKPGQGSAGEKLQRLARFRFLKKQAEVLLNADDLDAMWVCLRENCSVDNTNGVEKMNYEDFCQIASICTEQIGNKCKRFFSPSNFLKFEKDELGRIAILPFYLYVMRTVSLTQARIDMCELDDDGDGYLQPQEMEAYVRGLIPNLAQLRDIPAPFVSMYCRIATRKFFFFCDNQRRGKLCIKKVLLSNCLAELMELHQCISGKSNVAKLELVLDYRKMTRKAEKLMQAITGFLFAVHKEFVVLVSLGPLGITRPLSRVFKKDMFLALDKDLNGTLNKQELQAYSDGTLTEIFIERVFDEHVRRGRGGLGAGKAREMDFDSFLDFVLALENRDSQEGLTYLFKCLDLHSRGFLTAADVHTLFRDVHRKWIEGGNYDLSIDDVRDEIWDMVKPADPPSITLSDMINCRQGGTIASMLTDVRGFWAHDNRENLLQEEEEVAEEEGE